MGLVSLCVEDDLLQQTALEIAVELANGAQSAIRWTKYALNNWLRMAGPTFDASTAFEMLGFTGHEVREGLASHLEAQATIPEGLPDLTSRIGIWPGCSAREARADSQFVFNRFCRRFRVNDGVVGRRRASSARYGVIDKRSPNLQH